MRTNRELAKSALHLAKDLLSEERCDRCGATFDTNLNRELSAVLDFDFGYLSSRDGERQLLLFCNDCAEKLQDSIMNKS